MPGKKVRKKIRKALIRIQKRDGLVRSASSHILSALGRNSGGPFGKRIMMLHIGRCGSTVLGNMLNEQSGMLWDGEALNWKIMDEKSWRDSADRKRFNRDTFRLEIRRRFINAGRRRYGFELKPEHVFWYGIEDPLETRAILEELGFGVFMTIGRTNVLRQLVSSIRGVQSGQWHLKAEEQRSARTRPVDCDPAGFRLDRTDPVKSLEEQLAERQRWMEWNREVAGDDALHLDFETHIMKDPVVAYRMICEHIGVDAGDIRPALRRTNPDSVEKLLADPQAWRDRLQGTRFEWMMNEE